MMEKLFKITFAAVLLGTTSLAHAIQFGQYEVVPDYEGFKNKTFNVCIEKGGSWHVSGDAKNWTGKWSETTFNPKLSKKRFILQAIHAQGKKMKSIALGGGFKYGYYSEVATSGKTDDIGGVELKYKGGCASAPAKHVQAQGAIANNQFEMREKPPLGPWTVGALYKNGKFESCGAEINGASGGLAISSNPNEEFHRLYLPEIAGLKPGSKTKVRIQFNNDAPYVSNEEVSVDSDGRVWMKAHEGLTSEIFGFAEMEGEGKMRNSRDLRIWVAGKKMEWHLTHTFYIPDVLEICENQEIHPEKPMVEMWTDRFSPPAMTGVLKSELSGPNTCLSVNKYSQLDLASCNQQSASEWTLPDTAFPSKIMRKVNGVQQCLTDEHGQLFMRPCGDSNSQSWLIKFWKKDPAHVRLTNGMFTGKTQCLEEVDDGRNHIVKMAPCGNYAGQAWIANLPDDMKL